MDARDLAAGVLRRVWEEDAFASVALDMAVERANIAEGSVDARDVGLATELVYGVLRTQAFLEDRISSFAKHGSWNLEGLSRAHVLIAAYTILFLDRVPAFAAVSEAVRGVRADNDRASGFANALLRKLAASVETTTRPVLEDAIAASAPGWLRGSLRRALGRRGATAFLAAGPVPPSLGLALAQNEDRAEWIEKLGAAREGASVEAGKISPRAILLRGAGDPRKLPGCDGAWIVEEEGAQTVALAVGTKAGDKVLDACAGRGTKCFLIGHAVGAGGRVDAADLHTHKIERLRASAIGALVGQVFVVDWLLGSSEIPRDYDHVLVDAPCSGVGTLRRRPEIMIRRTPEDVTRLAELQLAITRKAALHARDGGIVTYAVCSVLREEAEDVAYLLEERRLEDGRRLVPIPFDAPALVAVANDAPAVRLAPHLHGTDGYFVARFRVERGSPVDLPLETA